MTDHLAPILTNPGLAKVLTVLHQLGEATAAAVAEHAGLAYSTTTPKLRKLEDAGLAEPFRAEDRRTLWRVTPAGHILNANSAASDTAAPATAAGPDVDQSTTMPPVSAEAIAGQDRPVNDEPTRQPQLSDPRPQPEQYAATDVQEQTRPDPVATVNSSATRPARPTAATSTPTGHQPPQPTAAATPQSSDEGADKAAASIGDHETRLPGVDDAEATPTGSQGPGAVETAPAPTGSQPQRRPKGALRGAIVDILENHPDRQYKVGELCKLINETQRQSGLPSASAGAVANALDKLIIAGVAVQTVVAPVTVQLAPPTRN